LQRLESENWVKIWIDLNYFKGKKRNFSSYFCFYAFPRIISRLTINKIIILQ
jgi:hypothetical protein